VPRIKNQNIAANCTTRNSEMKSSWTTNMRYVDSVSPGCSRASEGDTPRKRYPTARYRARTIRARLSQRQ
jgi:hypothetical protein